LQKSPSSGTGEVSKRLMPLVDSAQSRVRIDQCFSAVRAVVVPLFVCLLSSYNYMTEVGGAEGS
jgi:hypothetical protein